MDGYNMKNLTTKFFNFYVGGIKVNKKKAVEGFRLGLKVKAIQKKDL